MRRLKRSPPESAALSGVADLAPGLAIPHRHVGAAPGGGLAALWAGAQDLLARRVLSLPLLAWCALASSASMIIGWNWDISWHRCIGRDTLWTPAHIAIYIALAIAFVYCALLVLSFTFGLNKESLSIRVLGFRGPSGAFLTLWGVLLQFLAVLFDAWWHEVYGLDSAVNSPPHALIAWGMNLFFFGQLLLVVRHHNAAPAGDRASLWAVLAMGGIIIGHWALAADPTYGVMAVRSQIFVATSPFAFALILVLLAEYLRGRWAATISSLIYAGLIITLMQVFQLFPAAPRFAPVFHPVERFYPPAFPLLVVVPAFLIDWIVRRADGRRPWLTSVLVGVALVPTFTAANWVWSEFLSSPLAANRFFGGHYPGAAFEEFPRVAPTMGLNLTSLAALCVGIGIAIVVGRASLAVAGWFKGVVR